MTSRLPWHDNHWARLASSRRDDRVPHALLLQGPAGLGKQCFADALAQALVCPKPNEKGEACGRCAACKQAEAGNHPDILHLAPEEPGRQIKIDAIRRLVEKSVLSAQPAAYRVCLIRPADAMNHAAANALLKTLEEPTPRTVIILVSSRPDRLPATIRSRCQSVVFRVPPAEVAKAWLIAQREVSDPEDCLQVAAGAPLMALEAATEDWLGEARGLVEDLTALKAREVNPVQVVENWEERSLTAVTAGLKRLCSDMVKTSSGLPGARLYHPMLHSTLQTLVKDIDLAGLFRFADRLTDCDRSATNNANTQMALEHLVNGWLQLTRPGGR